MEELGLRGIGSAITTWPNYMASFSFTLSSEAVKSTTFLLPLLWNFTEATAQQELLLKTVTTMLFSLSFFFYEHVAYDVKLITLEAS